MLLPSHPSRASTGNLARLEVWFLGLSLKQRAALSLVGLAGLAGAGAFFFSQFTQARGIVDLAFSRIMLAGLLVVGFLMCLLVFVQLWRRRLAIPLAITFPLLGVIGLDSWAPKSPNPKLSFGAQVWHGEVTNVKTMYGIQWKPNYSATTLSLLNTAAFVVENVDFTIGADTNFVAVSQSSAVNGLQIRDEFFQGQLSHLEYKDAAGHTHSIPLSSKTSMTRRFHIHCPRLESHESLSLLVASVDISNNGAISDNPRELDFIEAEGSFETTTIDGTKRFPIKWRQDFRKLASADNPETANIKLGEFANEGMQTSIRCFQSGDETTCETLRDAWVQRVCDYLDSQLGHIACVAVRSQLLVVEGQLPQIPPPRFLDIGFRMQTQVQRLRDIAKTLRNGK